MTESVTGVRRKIASCRDLQAVVRTMKALSASSIGQYERSVLALGEYAQTVELGLRTCLTQLGPLASRAAMSGADGPRSVGAIVFGSDQGLVGRFNEVVVEHAVQTLASWPGGARVWVVGERAHARLLEAGLALEDCMAVPSSIQAVAPLARQLLLQSEASHERGELTELHLFYNRPGSGSGYAPVNLRLLPLDERWVRHLMEIPWPTKRLAQVLGDPLANLRAFLHESLFLSVFRACAESLASENASRLAAMQRADQNIDGLLEQLQVAFHRMRQSGIDEELYDVVSGFEALKGEVMSGA
ncbi:MAG: F0F1 ATP synthase subunit gamma [Planctomycetota bacterium]